MSNKKPTKFRKWNITINNPQDKGLDHDAIKKALELFKGCEYWCMSDEIGLTTHTPHTHIYLQLKNGAAFSTVQKRFPGGHYEIAGGSARENRDYIQKSGKWAEDEKTDTSVEGTFEESGPVPDEPGQGARTDIATIYAQIKDGMTNAEIIEARPDSARYINLMDRIRLTVLDAQYGETFNESMEVTYIWGPTGTGKTRGVVERYGYRNTYRVTDYRHPFDGYSTQGVMVFEEFRSSLMIGEMLNYMDKHPHTLPARYSNKQGCYDAVYIISNIDLREQYTNVQENEPETWKAFLRRIDHVIEYRSTGPPIDHGNATDYIYPPPPPVPEWVQEAEQAEQIDLPF